MTDKKKTYIHKTQRLSTWATLKNATLPTMSQTDIVDTNVQL